MGKIVNSGIPNGSIKLLVDNGKSVDVIVPLAGSIEATVQEFVKDKSQLWGNNVLIVTPQLGCRRVGVNLGTGKVI